MTVSDLKARTLAQVTEHLPAAFLKLTVVVVAQEDALHLVGVHACTGRTSYTRGSATQRSITVETYLSDPQGCGHCLEKLTSGSSYAYYMPREAVDVLGLLTTAWEGTRQAERTLERYKKGHKVARTKLQGFQDLQGRLGYAVTALRNTPAMSAYASHLQDALDGFEAATTRTAQHTQELRQDVVLKVAQAAMVPPRLRDTPGILDETPVLMGMCPGEFRGGSKDLREVIDAFTTSQEPSKRLMVGPRYVYDYLQRFGGLTGRYFAAVEKPEDHLVDTTFGIWSPEGEGDLAGLGAAVEAARILHES